MYYLWNDLFAFFQTIQSCFLKQQWFQLSVSLKKCFHLKKKKKTDLNKDWNGSTETGPGCPDFTFLPDRVAQKTQHPGCCLITRWHLTQDLWPHFGDSSGFINWESFCISAEPDRFFSQSFWPSPTAGPSTSPLGSSSCQKVKRAWRQLYPFFSELLFLI